MDDLVRARGNDVFLDEQLDAIRDRLKKPERPDAVRAVTVLNATQDFSLEDRDEREERHKYAEHRGDLDQTRGQGLNPLWRRGDESERKQPMLQRNKSLIDGIRGHPL